jgi:tol-pal system protein YbgF
MKLKTSLINFIVIFILSNFLLFPFFTGCSSSDDLSKTKETAPQSSIKEQEYRTQVNRLKSSLDSAKQVNVQVNEDLQKSQQDNSNLTIKLNETEKELSDLKSRLPDNAGIEMRRKDYSDALALFDTKKYNEAIAKFQKIYSDDPSGELAPNCVYWVGECYNGLKNIQLAQKSFEQVLSAYPNSSKSDAAMLMLGICCLKLKDKAQAKDIFERLQQQFPDSKYIANIPREFKVKKDKKEVNSKEIKENKEPKEQKEVKENK